MTWLPVVYRQKTGTFFVCFIKSCHRALRSARVVGLPPALPNTYLATRVGVDKRTAWTIPPQTLRVLEFKFILPLPMALTLLLRRCPLRTCTVPVIFAHVDKLHSVVLVFQRDKMPFQSTLQSQMLSRTCSAKILLRRFRMERNSKEMTLPSFFDSSLNLEVIYLS